MQNRERSYTEVVYDVLRSAGRSLSFPEIFTAVNRQRPVTTRDPKATIRNALTQGRQLVSLGDGRYGYLPHLLSGSLLRLPLTGEEAANKRLVYPDEVRDALWPSFFEVGKRKEERPALARLPSGNDVVLHLSFFGRGVWGSGLAEGLRCYLAEADAVAGDSLLIRVVDAEAGRCELSLEPNSMKDEAAVAKRSKELADVGYELVRRSRSGEVPIWDLALALLARGLYRADVAPDPLEEVLKADSRFVSAGLSMWLPAEAITPDVRALIRRRKAMEGDLYQVGSRRLVASEEVSSALSLHDALERALTETAARLSERGVGSVDEAMAILRGILTESTIQVGRSKHSRRKPQA